MFKIKKLDEKKQNDIPWNNKNNQSWQQQRNSNTSEILQTKHNQQRRILRRILGKEKLTNLPNWNINLIHDICLTYGFAIKHNTKNGIIYLTNDYH